MNSEHPYKRKQDKSVKIIELTDPIPYPSFFPVEPGQCLCYYVELQGNPPPYPYACAECNKSTDGMHCLFVGTQDGFTHCLMVCCSECGTIASTKMAAWMLTEGVDVVIALDDEYPHARWRQGKPTD